jgi:hypothetical protein
VAEPCFMRKPEAGWSDAVFQCSLPFRQTLRRRLSIA